MARRKTPPAWQKGRSAFEVTLPAGITRSGREETVTLSVHWTVEPTGPMTARAETRREMERARALLADVARVVASGQPLGGHRIHDLDGACIHAVRAWCRTHLRGKGVSNGDDRIAFFVKAPDDLKRLLSAAEAALPAPEERPISSAGDAVAKAAAAVEALLAAAGRPPRSRRRYPAFVRAGRPVRKPRVKPGGWIDTGRYRPAQVLKMRPEPPHTMTVSYGDETDCDFRPHIVVWRTVRKPRRLPSLKEVFSAGDWMRHIAFGYGRVLAVRDTTLDVDFRGRRTTLAPDARLSRIERVAQPEPEDTRPPAERFPPGIWICHDRIAEGVVLAVTGDTLTVLATDRVVRLSAGDCTGVVWRLDRPPLDLTQPRERRRMWWWQNDALRKGRRPCPCCGYPNLGTSGPYGEELRQCIVCGWTDDFDGEADADAVRPGPGSDDRDDPECRDRPNRGYSLAEARRNFEAGGVMFRNDDVHGAPFRRAEDLRRHLMERLDAMMADASSVQDDSWQAVEQIRWTILDQLH